MEISIFSDVICPWCYVGKRRLERALAEVRPGEVAIEWLPFELNPDMPPQGMPGLSSNGSHSIATSPGRTSASARSSRRLPS